MSNARHTPDLVALLWYEARGNNGRGRISGTTARLLKQGLLTLARTGHYTWVTSLSAKGRAAIAKARGES